MAHPDGTYNITHMKYRQPLTRDEGIFSCTWNEFSGGNSVRQAQDGFQRDEFIKLQLSK